MTRSQAVTEFSKAGAPIGTDHQLYSTVASVLAETAQQMQAKSSWNGQLFTETDPDLIAGLMPDGSVTISPEHFIAVWQPILEDPAAQRSEHTWSAAKAGMHELTKIGVRLCSAHQ